ncbi:helix-turn-helix domain-containing protein [Candidatus Electronema sp. PJ]|uniref:helix-turn-helix domain-containing protein n=1 Tax=Candidatus Electronema sp. PJ TaxID=3401572 RepID=UPI003AA8F254
MNISPIRSEEDYNKVIQRIDELIDSEPYSDEFNELEVLSILAEDYEEKNFPIGFPDPVEALRYIMEWKGITLNDLEPYIGTKAAVSQILDRKKELTIEMIMRLKKGLKISADVLIPESNEDVPILA